MQGNRLFGLEDAAEELGGGVVFGDEVLEGQDQIVEIAVLASSLDLTKIFFHPLPRDGGAGEDLDLLVIGGDGIFVEGVQLLIELLAGADSGELDFYILIRLKPGEQDEVLREIEDANGVAHIQDEDFAAFTHGG